MNFLRVLIVPFLLFYYVYRLVLLLLVAFLVLLERKVLRIIQIRKRPNIVGAYGLVQTVMDRIKLLLKHFLVKNTGVFFLLAPFLRLVLSFAHWLVIPFPFGFWSRVYSVVVSFVIIRIIVYVVLWSGWRSKSSYGVIGCIRGVAQIISYEVVFMFFLFCWLLSLGSYDWESFLRRSRVDGNLFVVFLLGAWVVIMLSELNRTPFDLVEGESELVSRFNVEYSRYRFTLLFLAEYMNIWFICLVSGLVFSGLRLNLTLLWLFFLSLVLWLRRVLPRVKYTQLIKLMWRVYLPLVLIFLTLIFCGYKR